MTDRKNLKISEETYELLRENKGRFETWDQCLTRMAETADPPVGSDPGKN